MELRHLKLIDVVAREGTLSKASDKLHLTQSALSHQLKEIESELGVLMFDRVNKRLKISESGNILRKASLNVQKEIDHAVNEIKSIQNGTQGEIRLSTECYTCYHWLPLVIKTMKEQLLDIDIKVLPEYTKQHFEGLRNQELDLVITSLLSLEPEIDYEELFQDEQLLIMSKDHPLSTKAYVNAEDLQDETLLIYSKPIEESTFYNYFLKPSGVLPKKFLEMRLTESAIQLVQNNLGVKVMARWAAEPYLNHEDNLTAIKIGPNGWYRKWYLAYHKSSGWKKHFGVFKERLTTALRDGLLNTDTVRLLS